MSLDTLPLPSDQKIASLCMVLKENAAQERVHRRYASTRRILTVVGAAGMIGISFFVPAFPLLAKPFLDEQQRKERELWKQYNPSFLRRSIKRLQQSKFVEIEEKDGEQIVHLTQKGKRRILSYAIDDLSISQPARWDGKWRVLIYDVVMEKKHSRDVFRDALQSLGFLKLQESVWIYPHACDEQITFLREFYGVGNEVIYIVAQSIEHDEPYREYFGLS